MRPRFSNTAVTTTTATTTVAPALFRGLGFETVVIANRPDGRNINRGFGALHPQTILAYGMGGEPLPTEYGAPLRLYSAVKLGYKNTKYLTKIVFLPKMNGGYWSDQGYEWYGGT